MDITPKKSYTECSPSELDNESDQNLPSKCAIRLKPDDREEDGQLGGINLHDLLCRQNWRTEDFPPGCEEGGARSQEVNIVLHLA